MEKKDMADLDSLVKENKLSITKIAEEVGIKYATVYYYIKGKITTNPNEEIYNKIYDCITMNIKNKESIITKEEHNKTTLQTVISDNKFNNCVSRYYNIKRHDIFYIENEISHESEQRGNRPAIVVGNDEENNNSPVLKVVYLTTREKSPLPTHVKITSSKYLSTALCEQIHSVSIGRFTKYYGHLTPEESEAVDKALLISVGVNNKFKQLENKLNAELTKEPVQEITNEIAATVEKDADNVNEELIRLRIENEMYKRMYEDFIRIKTLNN